MSCSRLLIVLTVWFVVAGSLLASSAEPQVLVLGGIIFVIMTVGFIGFDLVRVSAPVAWAQAPQPFAARESDEAIIQLVRDIERAHRSPSDLRGTLLSLADDRLLDHRNLDRRTNPAAAAEFLGPRLSALAEDRRTPMSDLDELHRLLDEIEAI